MSSVAELAISLLILLGGAFALIGSWGLVRLPSLMTRLHGATKATTLGVGGCLIGSMIYFPASGASWTAHELLVTLFLFITAPVSANMIAKAHLHRQRCRLDADAADGIKEELPEPSADTGWATFWTPEPAEKQDSSAIPRR
ncbi:Na+/H+ antiporter subunit G [Edaphosphingomonas haloaromaticamans]|uniref:Na(+)/H(+) antiporter subunit G n=1 Tax=Edaphosphingomonas haloaromaticamans TaxID=653954 RepID=A0A1S1HI01_9SPHN|nr:Na+/H+ antiporter subunit G [Sphingomonas haloaromaticamans]OHT21688.1 Na(+)/H(+) antiporter subunit G [Sphingomonas haloaromaticamans]